MTLPAAFLLLSLCGSWHSWSAACLRFPCSPEGIRSLCAHEAKKQLRKEGNGTLETSASYLTEEGRYLWLLLGVVRDPWASPSCLAIPQRMFGVSLGQLWMSSQRVGVVLGPYWWNFSLNVNFPFPLHFHPLAFNPYDHLSNKKHSVTWLQAEKQVNKVIWFGDLWALSRDVSKPKLC